MGLKEGTGVTPPEVTTNAPPAVKPSRGQKLYQKPAFRFERVFETLALSCGKIEPTQKHCRFNRKTS